jgi:hypothetical protein
MSDEFDFDFFADQVEQQDAQLAEQMELAENC